jgi:hypothetical protein
MVDWLTELIAVPTKEYPMFMAGLSFAGGLSPDDTLAALRQRSVALEFKLTQQRATLRASKEAGLPRLFMIEAEYEEQQVATELHFVNALVKDIASGDLDGLAMWQAFHSDGIIPMEGVVFNFETPPQ